MVIPPRQLPVIFRREGGKIVAFCPELENCWAFGDTKEEATERIQEAILCCLEDESPEGLEQEREFELVNV